MSRENALLERIRNLTRIGIMLSRERQLDRLLASIVEECRRFYSCEAGSLFTRDGADLYFRIAQNEKLNQHFTIEMLQGQQIKVSAGSIAGYVAATGEILTIDDVYHLPPGAGYSFDRTFDIRNNYRTKSVLAIPLIDAQGMTLGVLQLINPRNEQGEVVTFAFVNQDPDLVRSLASQAAIALSNAQLIEQMRNAHIDTIFRLSVAAEYKDEDTASHLERMCRYSAIIATQLKLPTDTIELIRLASPMHDVGKIGIPDAILLKPGRLTEQEFSIMKKHPIIGARILGGSASPLLKMAESIAISHHEKYDGGGYPRGLQGEVIPLEGRIVALADVFDALTSRRCYKPAWTIEKSVELIRDNRGKHFDPGVVDAFLARLADVIEVKKRFDDEPVPKKISEEEKPSETPLA